MTFPFKKSRYKELTDVFDKQYIEDMFEAAIEDGQINPTFVRQWIPYQYHGWHYTIIRVPINVVLQKLQEEQLKQQQIVKRPEGINDDPLGIGNDPWHKTRKYYKDKKVKPPDEI